MTVATHRRSSPGAPDSVQRRAPARDVLVVDAGFLPTTRRMALAVADRVSSYVTPLALDARSPLARVPGVGAGLHRRTLPRALAARAVHAGTAHEGLRLALGRARLDGFAYDAIWRRNRAVDRAASSLVDSNGAVIGQYGACLRTLRIARRLGARTVLDYPIARDETVRRILDEEAQLRPDFADTIAAAGTVTRPEHVERIERELDLADAVIVGSRFAAASFVGRLPGDRVRVVPYGVDTQLFSPVTAPAPSPRRGRSARGPAQDAAAPLRALFAGQITQRKGVAYLLDAMRLVDTRRVSLTLAGPVAGSGRGLAAYDGLFSPTPAVAPAAMPDVYRAHDVLVLPSLVEGSALVVLEAMACGLPVIVTPNAGADCVRDGVDGFVVPLRSPEAIAARLAQLAAEHDLHGRMSAAARARALEYGWSAFAARFRAATGLGGTVPA